MESREAELIHRRRALKRKLARAAKAKHRRKEKLPRYILCLLLVWGLLVGAAMVFFQKVRATNPDAVSIWVRRLFLRNNLPTAAELMIAVTALFALVLLVLYGLRAWRHVHYEARLTRVEDTLTYLNETKEDTALRVAEHRRYRKMRRRER